MKTKTSETWLLHYRREVLRSWPHIALVRGEHHLESSLRFAPQGSFGLTVNGPLIGEEYRMETSGRNQQPGDQSETELVFEGRFEHQSGCCGDFTACQKKTANS